MVRVQAQVHIEAIERENESFIANQIPITSTRSIDAHSQLASLNRHNFPGSLSPHTVFSRKNPIRCGLFYEPRVPCGSTGSKPHPVSKSRSNRAPPAGCPLGDARHDKETRKRKLACWRHNERTRAVQRTRPSPCRTHQNPQQLAFENSQECGRKTCPDSSRCCPRSPERYPMSGAQD